MGNEPLAVDPGLEIGDAWGAALVSTYQGNPAYEILERDDGTIITVGPMGHYFAPPAEWRDSHRWACDLARGCVLDLGAGTGRHSLHLQEKGLRVVALDVSPGCVEICRARGVREVMQGTTDDLIEAGYTGAFDTVLMLGAGVGHLQNVEYGKRFLESVLELLAEDGTIIMEGYRGFAEPWDEPNRRYVEANRARGKMDFEMRVRYRCYAWATPWFDWLHCTFEEAGGIFRSAGLEVVDERQYPPTGLYVIVAKRP